MSGPYVWGESKYLGTPQEEFDVATGYWKKWQRCEEEKAELLDALKEMSRCWHEEGVASAAWDAAVEVAEEAIAKAEAR